MTWKVISGTCWQTGNMLGSEAWLAGSSTLEVRVTDRGLASGTQTQNTQTWGFVDCACARRPENKREERFLFFLFNSFFFFKKLLQTA